MKYFLTFAYLLLGGVSWANAACTNAGACLSSNGTGFLLGLRGPSTQIFYRPFKLRSVEAGKYLVSHGKTAKMSLASQPHARANSHYWGVGFDPNGRLERYIKPWEKNSWQRNYAREARSNRGLGNLINASKSPETKMNAFIFNVHFAPGTSLNLRGNSLDAKYSYPFGSDIPTSWKLIAAPGQEFQFKVCSQSGSEACCLSSSDKNFVKCGVKEDDYSPNLLWEFIEHFKTAKKERSTLDLKCAFNKGGYKPYCSAY